MASSALACPAPAPSAIRPIAAAATETETGRMLGQRHGTHHAEVRVRALEVEHLERRDVRHVVHEHLDRHWVVRTVRPTRAAERRMRRTLWRANTQRALTRADELHPVQVIKHPIVEHVPASRVAREPQDNLTVNAAKGSVCMRTCGTRHR